MKTFEQAFEEAKKENEARNSPAGKLGVVAADIVFVSVFSVVDAMLIYLLSKALLTSPIGFSDILFSVLSIKHVLLGCRK